MRNLVLLAFPALLMAQQLSWRELPLNGAAPSGRVDGAIAFDERDKRIYMFGGRDSRAQNDLWVYSVESAQWTQLQPSGNPPAARFGHTLLMDATRRRLLLFGGQAGGFFSDTWAYDIGRNAWQQIAPGGAGPNERYGHSAVLDSARDRMIISHGFTDEGRFDDTWAFNLSTNRWQDISPSSNRPLRRCLHHAVLDAEGNQMLLYGGCASGFGPCPLGDLWSFDLTTQRWTERSGGLKPPERQWYGMGFDHTRRRLVLFGGSGQSGNLNDTWEYDPARNQWVQMRFTPAPSARSRHEAVFAPGLGVVFFGGSGSEGLSNQLLLLAANAVETIPRFSSAAVVNAFSGNPTPLAPGAIVSFYGSALGPMFGTSASLDSTGSLPKQLAGTSFTINGVNAPLLYVQSGQVNAQAPYEISGVSEAEVIVTYNGQSSAPVRLPVAAQSPGLHPSAFVSGDVIVLFATGTGEFSPALPTGVLADSDNLPTPLAPIELCLAGQAASILFAGHAPQTAGVLQINARLPQSVSLSEGRIEATLRVGNSETTTMLVTVALPTGSSRIQSARAETAPVLEHSPRPGHP